MGSSFADPKFLERTRDNFALLFYRWAQADAAKQAAQGFPLFALLRDSLAADYLRVYEGLPTKDKFTFLGAMVKRTHERAVALTGESISSEERELLRQFCNPPQKNEGYELEKSWKRPRLTPLDRNRLSRLIMARIANEARGNFEMWTPTELVFHRIIGPWRISTAIMIKSKQNLGYEHSIAVAAHPEARLKERTSITRWLGIGETNWNLMTPDEIDQCAEAPFVLANYFIDAIPELLAKLNL